MEPTRENLRAFDQLHRTRVDALDAGGRLPEAARDWRGARVLHLGCRTGETTAELVAVGALVIAVDPYEDRLVAARARVGDSAVFTWSELHSLPQELLRGRFDVVYSSPGSLLEVLDAARWTAGIGAALRQGGTFVLNDVHPASAPLDHALRWRTSYFDEGFVRIGHIVNGLADAGMLIRRFDELPAHDRRLGDPRVPARLLLTAEKL
jgi:SAM-dependent methyltransferase